MQELSFSFPIEYMLASTFSGRVVFTSEALVSYTGADLTGKNLNDIFSDDAAAQIIFSCRQDGTFNDTVSFLGNMVQISAKVENDEILIFVKDAAHEKPSSLPAQPVNKVSKELDSSVSVLSLVMENISSAHPDCDADSLALMNKQLMKLNRLSKNISSYNNHLANAHYVNYEKVFFCQFLSSLIESVGEAISDLPVKFTLNLPKDDFSAMIDVEKIRRVFLNVISNSIASRVGSINISITVYPVVSDIVNIVIRDNGRGFTPLIATEKCSPSDLVDTYNSFGFAVSHIFLHLHGGNFSVISEKEKGTVVSMSFPLNMDKTPPAFSSMIPSYSGDKDWLLMELSPVLPTEKYRLK